MRASRALHEALLRLANLSPVADGCMERCCLEMHQRPFKGPDGLLSGLETAAEKMALALEATEEKLETLLLQRGRKSSTPRDRLLADVADYMLTNSTVRITKRAAAGNASNLLAASGIDVPWGKEEVERIIRRARKGEK